MYLIKLIETIRIGPGKKSGQSSNGYIRNHINIFDS